MGVVQYIGKLYNLPSSNTVLNWTQTKVFTKTCKSYEILIWDPNKGVKSVSVETLHYL